MTIRVAVLGAHGRMGREVCRAVDADPDLELAAKVGRGDPRRAVVEAAAHVAVDFTVPGAVLDNVRFCVANGVHVVVGASGLGARDLDEIRALAAEQSGHVFVAPNFAVGAVLMMRFAAAAAPHFRTAEIVERHHERKLDAPSGTSLRTADMMNRARAGPWDEPQGARDAAARGADVDGVRIHSVRVPGSVAHQEVVLGAPGETLTIRHDSLDRTSFMPGVVLAVKRVGSLPGVTVGLEHLLETT